MLPLGNFGVPKLPNKQIHTMSPLLQILLPFIIAVIVLLAFHLAEYLHVGLAEAENFDEDSDFESLA